MKRSFYAERDYAFGERMLTLRSAIGLTQAGLAQRLGVSRKAVFRREAGESYRKAHHLQQLLTLAVRASAFPPGREEAEIRALWKAAHQKVLLDEAWLSALLKHGCTLRRDQPYERLTITSIRGLTQAEIATLRALEAVEDGKAAS